MEEALVFLRVLGGVLRRARCHSRTRSWECLVADVPTKDRADSPRPIATLKTSEARLPGCFFQSPFLNLQCLFFTAALLTASLTPSLGNCVTTANPEENVSSESAHDESLTHSKYTQTERKKVEPTASAWQARTSDVSTLWPTGEHTQVHPTATARAQVEPSHHPSVNRHTSKGESQGVKAVHSSSQNGAEKGPSGMLAAAAEKAAKGSESTKTIPNAHLDADHALTGTQTTTQKSKDETVHTGLTVNEQEEGGITEGSGAAEEQTDGGAKPGKTKTPKDTITVGQWFEAITSASLDPQEAAAVAAELPVVTLSRYEQILVQQLLRLHGFTQLATHLQETNKESTAEFGENAEDGVDRDKTLNRKVYEAAVEVLKAYKETNPELLSDTIQPFPSYEDVSKEQKDFVEKKAAEVIMLRVVEAMVEHAQNEYRERQERLRQGVPSEPHLLLAIIERNKRKQRSMPYSMAQSVRIERPPTPDRGEGTREEIRLAALQKYMLRDPTVLETPVWGFMDRELAKLDQQYRSQGRLRSPVKTLHTGLVGNRSEEESLGHPNVKGDGYTGAADPSHTFYSQLQRISEASKGQYPSGRISVEERDLVAQPVVGDSDDRQSIELAARAILTDRDEELEGLSEQDKLRLKMLQRVLPESVEAWKAALADGDATALDLLRILPPEMYLPNAASGKRLAHPGARVRPRPSIFPQDAPNLHSPQAATIAQVREVTSYPHQTAEHPLTVSASGRSRAPGPDQMIIGETGVIGDPLKLPLLLGDHLLTYEGLQMHLAAEAKKQHDQMQTEDRPVPNTFPPSTSVAGQTIRKRLQATSTPSLEQFITPKTKLGRSPKDVTESTHEIPIAHASVLQQDAQDHSQYTAYGSTLLGVSSPMSANPVAPSLGKEEKEDRDERRPAVEEANLPLHTPETEDGEQEAGEGRLTPKMLAVFAALLPRAAMPPPVLLYLQQQLLSVPYNQAPQQTPPESESNQVPEHTPAKIDSREHHLHHPESLVGLHGDENAAATGVQPENPQDETVKFLRASIPMWGIGPTVSERPTFTSAGEGAAAVDAGTDPHVVPPATLPIITLKGSSSAKQFSFGTFTGLDARRVPVSHGWRYSPPTPPALQTLSPQGMIPDDAEDAEQEGNEEDVNQQQAQSIFLTDPTRIFGPTPPPYSALVLPPQHPTAWYPSGTSAPATAEEYQHPHTGAPQQFFQISTPAYAPHLRPHQPLYPPLATPEVHPAPPTGEEIGQLMYEAEQSADGSRRRSSPGLLPPAHVAQSHHVRDHSPHALASEYEKAEHLEDGTATGRHMRAAGSVPALSALVDGSLGTRQAVEVAASALPQLAHSAEQLMTTTSSLVNAGNALAKSLPIEEAAKLGQHLNEMRMRRKEGPPMPSVGDPSVRCLSSGMICCVPQKAVGPEWKKRPPYLNDSSPSNRACQAHFVPLQDAVCAATEYDDKECGIERMETSSMIVFKHSLHVRGPKGLTATCECHWTKSDSGKAVGDAKTLTISKGPGETVEGFAQWEYSKKAAAEGQAARARTGKLLSGLGAALKATALVTEQGSNAEKGSDGDREQQAGTIANHTKSLSSGVSAIADALLDENKGSPSMKYVKQALADIARATGSE